MPVLSVIGYGDTTAGVPQARSRLDPNDVVTDSAGRVRWAIK
jgi:hypothetical protein